jgi:hypothetical protein
VLLSMEGRACNFSGGCVAIEIGPCLVPLQRFCGNGSQSVVGILADAVW